MRLPSGSGRCPPATALLTDSEKTLTMLASKVPSGWLFAVTATYMPRRRSAGVMVSCRRTRVVGVRAKLVPSPSVILSAAAPVTVPSMRTAPAAGPARDGLAAGVAATVGGLEAGAVGALTTLAPPRAGRRLTAFALERRSRPREPLL